MTLRIGSRGSRLALAQTTLAVGPLDDWEIVVVRTRGDESSAPIAQLGEGVFVRALEDALRRGDIDVAVHSLKDMPTAAPEDLTVAAIPAREDPRDVLITRDRAGLGSLRAGATVGTGSVRRAAFLKAARPDVVTREIRGNVDTRLAKVTGGEYDAVVLALAGLRRLGLEVVDDEVLGLDLMLPAPGQGALALQCRADDGPTRARLGALDHTATRAGVEAERALLRRLGATCEIPLGAHGRGLDGAIVMDVALVTDGVVRRASVSAGDPESCAAKAQEALGAVPVA